MTDQLARAAAIRSALIHLALQRKAVGVRFVREGQECVATGRVLRVLAMHVHVGQGKHEDEFVVIPIADATEVVDLDELAFQKREAARAKKDAEQRAELEAFRKERERERAGLPKDDVAAQAKAILEDLGVKGAES
jgi:hypothetical protein